MPVQLLKRLFTVAEYHKMVGEREIVWVQNPIDLGEHSELQPDLAVLKPRADFYAQAHPEPEDVLLLLPPEARPG